MTTAWTLFTPIGSVGAQFINPGGVEETKGNEWGTQACGSVRRMCCALVWLRVGPHIVLHFHE
jgi:hypothetical protein